MTADSEPITGPAVAGQPAADRLMGALDYRLHPGTRRLSRDQVAVVLHALADHTAIQAALVYRPDLASPWPHATSMGRWLHDVADDLDPGQSEYRTYLRSNLGVDSYASTATPQGERFTTARETRVDGVLQQAPGVGLRTITLDPPLRVGAGETLVVSHDPATGHLIRVTNTTTGESRDLR